MSRACCPTSLPERRDAVRALRASTSSVLVGAFLLKNIHQKRDDWCGYSRGDIVLHVVEVRAEGVRQEDFLFFFPPPFFCCPEKTSFNSHRISGTRRLLSRRILEDRVREADDAHEGRETDRDLTIKTAQLGRAGRQALRPAMCHPLGGPCQ